MASPKKLTVYSEGFGSDVKVIDENGDVITGIQSATIYMAAGEYNKIELVVQAVATNIQASVHECQLTCPLCGTVEDHTCA